MDTHLKRRIFTLLLAVCLLLTVIPVQSHAAAEFTEVGGWYETIYAVLSGVTDSQVTGVSWTGKASGSLAGEDLEYLVRDTADGVRLDIPGLSAGTYTLTVNTALGTLTQKNIQVTAYDRSGYAHYQYTDGVGAYRDDGTLKDNAIVLYVTNENKNTVTLTAKDGTSVSGIGNILNTSGAAGVSKGASNTNNGILKKLANQGSPLVVRIIGNVTAPEGLTAWGSIDYGGNTDDNGSLARMQNCRNITIEGIGSGVVCNGWGFTVDCKTGDSSQGLGKSFEFRNLTFRNVPEDCIGFSGKSADNVLTDPIERCWVHHCAFYGPNGIKDASKDQDKGQGDGAFDFKLGQYCTLSYCYFEAYHKTSLVGGGDSQMQYHITWHHNYWKNCESRIPLGRQANMHLYNNVAEGQSSYCMSLRANLYIFSEYNYFLNCKKVVDDNTGGVCKSYNNTLINSTYPEKNTHFVIISDKNTQVESGNKYANFDTDPSLSYIPSGDYTLLTDPATIYDSVTAGAGPQKGKETKPDTETGTPEEIPGSKIHNFTTNGLTSDFYTFTSCSTNGGKGTVNYNGLKMTTCLKLESATNVSFEAPADGKLLLVFYETGINGITTAGQNVLLNGTSYTVGQDNTVVIPVKAGTNTLQRGAKQIYLYYMAYIPNRLDLNTVAMNLGNSLTMIFYVPAAEVSKTDYALITKSYADGRDDVTVKIPMASCSTVSYNGAEYYLAGFDGIAAKEMTDNVTCVIYNSGGTAISNSLAATVKDYVQASFALGDAKLNRVMADLLNYGAAAQKAFGYNTGYPANADMTEEQQGYATKDIDVNALAHYKNISGVAPSDIALLLKNNTRLMLYYPAASLNSNMVAKISYTDHHGNEKVSQVKVSDFGTEKAGQLCLIIDTLLAADYKTTLTVEIYDGTELVSSNEVNMVKYCALNPGYVASIPLAKYCQAAYSYFHQ